MNTVPHFFDLDLPALKALFTQWGLPAFRAEQVTKWVYEKHVADPALMSNLSKHDRELLAKNLVFTRGKIIRHQEATDGVQKLLMEWSPLPTLAEENAASASTALPIAGQTAPLPQTECVMIPTDDRKTACISSQVGCPVGCRFCASGVGGLETNLTTGQIVEQVWRLSTLKNVGRISNVVFMGMGEPLSNFDNVVGALRQITSERALGISARKVTVSTVGVPAQIRRLAEIDLPVTLALSLHAPNDDVRRTLIPWAQYVTIEQLLDACQFYFDKTGREITLEYTLLHDVNDRAEHARELTHIARRIRANINLIRYNEVKGMPFNRPETDDVLEFQRILKAGGINTHIRASRGRDIAAACGQLRYEEKHTAKV